jgi:hypothetical protein
VRNAVAFNLKTSTIQHLHPMQVFEDSLDPSRLTRAAVLRLPILGVEQSVSPSEFQQMCRESHRPWSATATYPRWSRGSYTFMTLYGREEETTHTAYIYLSALSGITLSYSHVMPSSY